MKKITFRWRKLYSGVLIVAGLSSPLMGGNEESSSKLRAHEWGTFTTFHKSNGTGLPWYQSFGRNSVSELRSFVSGNRFQKVAVNATARMETPVLYFYTDEKQSVDVNVTYNGGYVTEFYPGTAPFRQWKGLELIPVAEAGDLIDQLPTDPKRPDNHYFEARAVPEAVLVRMQQPADKEGNRKPDQLEKFVFYRGAGSFATGLHSVMKPEGVMTLIHYRSEYGMKHVWVLRSSAEAVRWEKLPEFPAFDSDAKTPPVEIRLDSLNAGTSREASISGLKESMVAALIDAGLTTAEAAAMVATWDEQWYEEPGQRVFSIAPQCLIDEVLLLEITPAPSETVRVFVHRSEILSPETEQRLESAMAPGADPDESKRAIQGEQLGRFVFGAIDAVANDVGFRTIAAYRQRGLQALAKKKEPKQVAQSLVGK